MRVLGIDPGTAITGYGLVDYDGDLRLVDCGAIVTPAGMALPQRLLVIHSDLTVAFSGGDDGTLKLWDVSTGRCERVFEGTRTA